MSNNNLMLLDGLELSKSTIDSLSNEIVNKALEGFDSALELDIKLKFIEETIKLARSKINTLAINQSIGITRFEGCKITAKKGGQTLDYEKDQRYNDLKAELELRKQHLDQAYKFDGHFVTNDGEIIPKIPVKTFVKDSIYYTFKK